MHLVSPEIAIYKLAHQRRKDILYNLSRKVNTDVLLMPQMLSGKIARQFCKCFPICCKPKRILEIEHLPAMQQYA